MEGINNNPKHDWKAVTERKSESENRSPRALSAVLISSNMPASPDSSTCTERQGTTRKQRKRSTRYAVTLNKLEKEIQGEIRVLNVDS
jgi:hypothetical protein